MARETQNRRIVLFSFWSFNQSEAGKKYLFNKKKNILYDTTKHDQIHQYFTNLD